MITVRTYLCGLHRRTGEFKSHLFQSEQTGEFVKGFAESNFFTENACFYRFVKWPSGRVTLSRPRFVNKV